MNLQETFSSGTRFLMEGALGERLKREFSLVPDPNVALAVHGVTEDGRRALALLWREYAGIARTYRLPFLAASPTRRANRKRAEAAGWSEGLLRENMAFLRSVFAHWDSPVFLGGLMGCCGDAYTGSGALSEAEAAGFHRWQAEAMAQAGADYLYGALLPTLPEAAGLARAMADTGLPYLISFTIRRDGRLIDGTPISAAIAAIDGKPFPRPLCYMANCVHPSIVYEALSAPCNQTPAVRDRFLGVQGNTSPLPYEELDRATDLLTGDPVSFARDTVRLLDRGPFQIFGGCCGTDGRHLKQTARLLQRKEPS